jgi:hypothetical protein
MLCVHTVGGSICNMDQATLDFYLDLLSHRHRRAVVERLQEKSDNRVSFEALVEELTNDDTFGESDGVTTETEIATRLHHADLPKLAAHGVVEYETDTGTVEYCPPAEFERVLELLSERPPQPTA